MSVPWPVLAFRSRRRAHPRRARSRRAGLRRSRAGAQALPRPGGVRLRHARRAPGPHRRDARDRAAALRGSAPRPEEGPHRPVRRPGAVGGLVGVVVRDLARSGPAPLPPRRARPARHREVGRPQLPEPPAAAIARSVQAAGAAQLRQPHRRQARLLHDGRHRARHRRAAPGPGRRQDRAHGDLLRHARRVAVRARVPRPRRPAHPRLDRRAGRTRSLPARHLPQHAARAGRAVRPRRLPQRDARPGGRRRRARAADERERPAARRLLRRERPQARHAVLDARRALLPAHRRRPQPVPAGGPAGRGERRPPR